MVICQYGVFTASLQGPGKKKKPNKLISQSVLCATVKVNQGHQFPISMSSITKRFGHLFHFN